MLSWPVEDAETGLYYNRHRYYDPDTARFIKQGSVGLEGGWNLYQFAPNPVSWVDPLGLTRCRSAAATLRRLKGVSISQIEKELTKSGLNAHIHKEDSAGIY